jgi:hypothetical protein
MAGVDEVVAHDARRRARVLHVHDVVDVAVVVEVAERGAAAHPALGEGGPELARVVAEAAGAVVHEEAVVLARLQVERAAEHHQQVVVAVEVEVGELRAPRAAALERRRETAPRALLDEEEPRLSAGLRLRRVAIEAALGEVRHEEVEGAVAVAVADRPVHRRHRIAGAVERDPGIDRDLHELPAVVAPERVGHRVERGEDVEVAVVVEVAGDRAHRLRAGSLEAGLLRDVDEADVTALRIGASLKELRLLPGYDSAPRRGTPWAGWVLVRIEGEVVGPRGPRRRRGRSRRRSRSRSTWAGRSAAPVPATPHADVTSTNLPHRFDRGRSVPN